MDLCLSFETLTVSRAILDVPRRQRDEHVPLPAYDPPIYQKCTIQQTDGYDCGPFVLREVEKLMGLSVDGDQQNPVRIRLRHIGTIHRKTKVPMMNKVPDDPLNDYGITVREEKKVHLNAWKTEDVARAKTCTESSVIPLILRLHIPPTRPLADSFSDQPLLSTPISPQPAPLRENELSER